MPCECDSSSGPGAAPDLWAMADELERQFAGYKQRLAERTTTGASVTTAARDHDHDDGDGYGGSGGEDGAEEDGDGDDEAGGGGGRGGCDARGRMYEAYVRRRDERLLRDGCVWRARMEREEAEVKALWAQLELAAACRAGGGDPTTAATDGDEYDDERKTERNNDDRRRSSSDAALAPRRITGKKHVRTRSFSSSIATTRNLTDVGRRRALSQEPPPPSQPADASSGETNKESPGVAAAATTATTRPRTSLRRRNSSVKGQRSAKQAAAAAKGPKLPRSLPRQASSGGGLEVLGSGVAAPAVVQASAAEAVAPPVPSNSTEEDSSCGTGAENAGTTSPEPDRGAVDEGVSRGEPEATNAGAEKHGEENADTSDSEPEPSYVYVNKVDAAAEEQQAMALSEHLEFPGSSDAALGSDDVKASEETLAAPAPAPEEATEIATTTNAEEAPARESSDESSALSVSVRSSAPPSARPSCSSRERSVERVLEADDAVVVRKKRAEKKSAPALKTPPPGSRFSGSGSGGGTTARSPRETTVRGFKRFLSFGKKHRGREATATVIDCTSPSVQSPPPGGDDSGSSSGRWRPAGGGSIKPRMGSSDAASDDTDHGYPLSPQAACSLQSLVAASPAKSELAEIVPQEKSPKVHRSFFSFRSLNCGRG